MRYRFISNRLHHIEAVAYVPAAGDNPLGFDSQLNAGGESAAGTGMPDLRTSSESDIAPPYRSSHGRSQTKIRRCRGGYVGRLVSMGGYSRIEELYDRRLTQPPLQRSRQLGGSFELTFGMGTWTSV